MRVLRRQTAISERLANSPKTDAQGPYRMTTADYHLNNSGATYSSGGHHDRLSEGNSERKKHMRKFAKSTTTNSELLLPNLTEANRIVLKDNASMCALNLALTSSFKWQCSNTID